MRTVILFCLAFIFATAVIAAEEGFTTYILGISEPVTKDKIKQAKADIKKAGGEVTNEITLGMHALIVSLPSDRVQALDNKDYIGFMEKDQIVHALEQ
ncbi:uncharacterized protein EV154DRAFT_561455 [Mucor mucedo]|uniref:Inhibitor I9 domain-containing protein n=1 Tax=Mucor saturninus TaxID=64648 RepID=A0A8H7RGG4_9FUNG|nr:uncharacterized protein EV154DRAFT_561455 [Mucor mucedo]KAG2210959.1 hypothetical protein INT47_000119 [Mucor saturninus]KAI7893230.1 hypothetical protein EV154DRAFT_561455 [Mucor mucedo]